MYQKFLKRKIDNEIENNKFFKTLPYVSLDNKIKKKKGMKL
jgi:hypothetical protein